MSIRMRLKVRRARPFVASEEPGEPAEGRPRTLVTTTQVANLRSQLASDATFRARWQTAVTQFETTNGYWHTGASGGALRGQGTDFNNSTTIAFAALLTCLRRSDNDLGLTWSYTWQEYRDRCVDRAVQWSLDAEVAGSKVHPLAVALIYDLLYNDMSLAERSPVATYVATRATDLHYCQGRWDDQTSWEHVGKVASGLAADDVESRVADLLANSQDWAEAREWMAYNSISYEWKAGYPAQQGPILCAYMLKNYGGYTDAQTLDKVIYHLQHSWQFVRQYVIPHPGRKPAVQARGNMVAPVTWSWVELNVASFLLWAFHLLPGKTNLTGASDIRSGGLWSGAIANQSTLAVSEDALLRHAYEYWLDNANTGATFSNVLNYQWVSNQAPTPSRGHLFAFMAAVPWLIENVQFPTGTTSASDAGLPKVRLWWPGTLGLTTIRSGFTISNSSDTLISYWHKRYFVNNYEGSTRQNGRWEVHRAGPLLLQRGSASHGPGSRACTWAANGTICFIDPDAYGLYEVPNLDVEDGGGCRAAVNNSETKAQVLSRGQGSEMGQITAWHADDQVVAITSDLTHSYNSTTFANPSAGNEAKIASFVREFVCVQRNGDGTDREKVFTYDRIVLADTKFVPKYNLCPAMDPTIDGTETANEDWGPQGAPVDDFLQTTWYASGPTRWDYANATKLIYDNVAEPVPNGGGGTNHTVAGNGKVCVTWLRPSGSGVSVSKRGGNNAYRRVTGPGNDIADGGPMFTPWGGWFGRDGEWDTYSSASTRAYNGLWTVEVYPTTVSSADQRFLMACEVMAATDTPGAAAELTCDADSVAARCGASAVVFSKETGTHTAGSVEVPSGVALVLLVNLPANATRTLTPGTGLSVTTSERAASSSGALVVGVSGAGTLTFA